MMPNKLLRHIRSRRQNFKEKTWIDPNAAKTAASAVKLPCFCGSWCADGVQVVCNVVVLVRILSDHFCDHKNAKTPCGPLLLSPERSKYIIGQF